MCLSWRDDWPVMPDGSDFDGEDLLTLVRAGNSPFNGVWDVNLLIQEIEENLGSRVTDILAVNKGSNNYVSFFFFFFFFFFSFFKFFFFSFPFSRLFKMLTTERPLFWGPAFILYRASTSNCRINWTSSPVYLVVMSTCPTFPASQSNRKWKRSSSRWRYIDSYAQSLEYWSPVCCITVSQPSTLVTALIPLRILPAVACFFSRKQREKRMYGGNSAQINRLQFPLLFINLTPFFPPFNRSTTLHSLTHSPLIYYFSPYRIAFLFRQPVSVHPCTDSIFRRPLPTFGFVIAYFNALPNKNPNPSPFRLVQLATFALLCSNRRLERWSQI